jgi:hypothetical protein
VSKLGDSNYATWKSTIFENQGIPNNEKNG